LDIPLLLDRLPRLFPLRERVLLPFSENGLAIFAIREKRKLELIQHVSTRGTIPCNFAFSPDEKFIVVANQDSGNLVVFRIDTNKGRLVFVDKIKAPMPVSILFKKD
jgi:6-phosphogluconolactonase